MHILGLIVEYNPFHNGHLYHLQQAKEITGADYVIAIMSGDFLQRGCPALIDKYSRTEMALLNGVDLLIQLPVHYSTGSAEYFAKASIELFNRLSIVDSVCFGSESGNIELLQYIADILVDEPSEYRVILQSYLREGVSFPIARSRALLDYISALNNEIELLELKDILASPNNILGIEYLKAIKSCNSNIKPYTIKRKTAGYHDTSLDDNITSATAIRTSLENINNINMFNTKVPLSTYDVMLKHHNISFPVFINDFTSLLYYKLYSTDKKSLSSYVDVSEGLDSRIYECSKEILPITELADRVKSKHVTLTRVYRALFHILLDINKEDYDMYNDNGYSQYAKILGFRKDASILLKLIKNNSDIYLVSKVAKAIKELDEIGNKMLLQDIYATDIYNIGVYNKFSYKLPSDYSRKIVTI